MRIKDKNRQNLIKGQGGRVNKIHYCLCQIANGPSLIDRSYQPISARNICFTSFSGHGPAADYPSFSRLRDVTPDM